MEVERCAAVPTKPLDPSGFLTVPAPDRLATGRTKALVFRLLTKDGTDLFLTHDRRRGIAHRGRRDTDKTGAKLCASGS